MKKYKLLNLIILFLGVMIFSNITYAAESNYLWPVPASTTINQPYGYNGHDGIDIGGAEGTAIVASKSGTVIKVLHGDETNWVGYGNGVVISHGDGYYTHYAHMSSVNVAQGQYVSQGQQIGCMGHTGNATGTHLHFAIATSQYGAGGRINSNADSVGYIYSAVPPVSETWSNKTETISETNAVLGITYNAGSSVYFGYVGLYINGQYACGYDPGYQGASYSFSFDLNKDANMTLQPGTTYTYKYYVNTMSGDTFGSEYSFTTKGQAPGATQTWANKSESISETNAVLGITYNAGGSKYFGWVGVNIWDSAGTLVGQAGFDPGYTGNSYNLSFNINTDTHQKLILQPGKTYKYQFYVNTLQNDIFSPEYTFTTKKTIVTNPTINPTIKPTVKPTSKPTIRPTVGPTTNTTNNPTAVPTVKPTSSNGSSINTDVTNSGNVTTNLPSGDAINQSVSRSDLAISFFVGTAGRKKATLYWGSNNKADGYEIQYSTNKKFKGKSIRFVSGKKSKLVIKSLKSKKKYYMRIRAYKDGVYGKWKKTKVKIR